MLSTLYREEPHGLFLYKDHFFNKGHHIPESDLLGVIDSNGTFISAIIYDLFRLDYKLPALYVIAKVVDGKYSNHRIDWRATFEFITQESLAKDQYKLYDIETGFSMYHANDSACMIRDQEVAFRKAELLKPAIENMIYNLNYYGLN